MKKVILTMGMMLPLTALASDKDILNEIEKLKQKIAQLEQSHLEQKKENETNKTTITNNNNILNDISKKVKVSGEFQFDSFVRKDQKNSPSDLKTSIPTAKINVSGDITEDLAYKVQYNLASSKLKKAYIDFSGVKYFDIRLGKFSTDFGLSVDDKFTNSASATILANVTGDVDGITLSKVLNDKLYLSGSFVTDNLNKNNSTNNFRTITTRAAYNPINNGEYIVHYGASAQFNKAAKSSDKKITYETGFDSAYGENAINGSVLTNNLKVYGLDLGFAKGPFSMQAEMIKSYTKSKNNFKTRFNSSYVQMSYFVTGEDQTYDVKKGFGTPDPKSTFSIKEGGRGAWELVTRYNHVNMGRKSILIDQNNNESIGSLGKFHTMSYGVNWYWNPNFNMKLNYIKGYGGSNTQANQKNPETIILKTHFSF
jgi:phosphate-selective porin OprO and OprP